MIKLDRSEEQFVEELKQFMAKSQDNKERLNGKLDLKLVETDLKNNTITFSFKAKEWCLNPYGTVHGGVICSVFDTALGTGAVAICRGFITTTDLNVNYLRPMTGENYIIKAEYVMVGKSLIRAEGRIYDADSEKLCATSLIGFMIMDQGGAKLRD